ncbi:hypothetical protein LM597_02350 [Candidatus Acetothermia bacterium]|nr:hypothetical protein [Candidatus Acetothermia bacterium]
MRRYSTKVQVAAGTIDLGNMRLEQINDIIKGRFEMFSDKSNNPLLFFGQRAVNRQRAVGTVLRRFPILPFGNCFLG